MAARRTLVTDLVSACFPPAVRKHRTLIAGLVSVGFLMAARPADLIVYNASPSIPPGFYVRVGGAVVSGSLVTVRARDVAGAYATWRGFTGERDRLIKRVAASEGALVCASGDDIRVGVRRVRRLAQDRSGHALPSWQGCRVLRPGEVFLLGDTADSFDSRYFGVVENAAIEGVWRPLLSAH